MSFMKKYFFLSHLGLPAILLIRQAFLLLLDFLYYAPSPSRRSSIREGFLWLGLEDTCSDQCTLGFSTTAAPQLFPSVLLGHELRFGAQAIVHHNPLLYATWIGWKT